MKKQEFINLLNEYGDATVNYRSKNSRKLKYNVCTLDFNNKHIQSKSNRAKESANEVLLFAWDTDSFRLLDPELVTKVDPLSATLKNESI